MNYGIAIGLGVAGLVLTKLAVDAVGGYVFTDGLLQDGLSQAEIEQRAKECMPFDMRYGSRIGRDLAYWTHGRKASRMEGQDDGVDQS